MDISFLREDYNPPLLRRKDLYETPYPTFKAWLEYAISSRIPEPNAMVLATLSPEGIPTTRMVLLKQWDEQHFTFFTNYESRKGSHIAQNPKVSLLFAWPSLYKQIMIEGVAAKTSESVVQEYFKLRPRKSQIAAWASDQSRPIVSRDKLEARFKAFEEKFAQQEVIPPPPYWGGYHVGAERIKFWQGGPNRLHDCFEYILKADKSWGLQRLCP